MATANPNLLEPDKSAESTTIQSSLIDTKETVIVPTIQATDQTLTEKCEDNPQVPNETETATTASDGIDLGQLMQKLTAYFKQNMKTSTQQTQSSRMPRHPKSVENFCYIMENHVPISNEEQQTLRGLINFGFIFDDINSKKSIEFLKKILKERLILILSKTSMENLSKPIQDEPLLSAIYVIDSSEENSFDSKFYRGSFSNITSLCKKLENDLQLLTYDLTSISSIPADYAGMSTLNYVQALIDILLETNEKRNLKKEMIDFCREEYADNIIQLKLIEEFENDFKPDDAIHWYLRHDAFLYKMMTRAFRVLDPDILFKLRYFIQHLYCQLKSSIDTSALTVHRTLRIRKDLLDKMKRHQGGLLSFNEFLLANKTQSAIEPSSTNIDSKLVRFQIGLGTGVSRHDVATKLNEVILTVGTIFRVDKIEPIDDGTFTVELTTNDEILKSGHLVTKSLRDAVHASFPLVRMVKLMKQKELTGYMEYFCSMLIDDPETVKDDATNLTLGGLLHSMGSYYYERKQYREALNHLQNALKVYLRVLPDDDVRLTPTYNNIGSVYNKQGLNEQALEYHLKAYEIQKNSPNLDMESVAAYVGNIGSVLIKLGRHKEAATYLELDLKIKQKLHPDNDHADVAAKYHNLAAAQFRLHQYSEALENYQKCLDIELKCHSDENPTVALTYYNMATTLEQLGQLQEAKEAVQKAIARLLLTKQPDDEDLQMQTKYLERLEKKIWMKNQLLRFRFQLRMTSVRLSRRREPANLRSSIILDSGTIFNQFEQALPIHEERRPIENKTRYPNLPDWHHRLPKSAKKKTHSPESSVTALSISQLQPSIENINATSEESEADEDQSVASEKSTEKSKPSEVKYTLPSKPSMDLPSSSSSTDAKKVPDTPAIAPTIQSPLLQPPISHQPQVVAVPSPPPPSLSTVHKSTTQQDPPVSFSKIQVEPAINESTLFKYVSDVMQQALSKPKLRQTISPRRIGNVEDFTILYINHDEDKDLSLLHSTVNSIRTISDSSTLGTLLSACTDEKFIVVMSINQAEVVLSELQQYKCIQSIYLLSKQSHPPESINGYGNAIEIYRNIESVCDHLIKALRHIPARVIPMEITSKDSVSDLPFTYCQLLKETILCHDDESDLRKDMLTFCRTHYTHNQDEVHVINEYEKSFIDTHSIQWYTRHCFLTKILSRAFRTQEIDLLFKMRYFIQCLHKQIQSIAIKEPITAYAILDVEQEIMQKFLGNINGLVLFRSFLPATFARPTSTEYQNKDTQRYLIFSIRLGPDCAANIEQLRSSDCKIDVLINIDTVFRVVSIDEGENEVHTVNLESVSLNDSHFQQLTESLRKQIKTSVVILQLAKLLVQTDHYWEGDYLTESIYQDKSFEGDGTLLAGLAAAHHLLGNVDDAKRDFEAARYQFFKSLRAFQLFLPYNHSLLSSSYNNIGSMFYQDDHHECAIKFHEMALECQLKASSPDMDAVATYSGNIGAVYVDQKNYAAATKHLERAAMILEKMPTKDNPTRLISIFQKISSCFWRTDEPKKALEYYKKTLDIQLKLINPLPHPLSVTYYNLSTAYARIGDYDEAVINHELMTTIDNRQILAVDRSAKKSSMNKSKQRTASSDNTSVSIPDNSCAVTMMYLGPQMIKSNGPYKFKIHADEILILQAHTMTGTKSIFKGCLKPNDEFTFKSYRLIARHLAITIYINGIIDQHIFVCCEKGFVNQSHFQTRRSSCQLLSITGGIPCETCQSHELIKFFPNELEQNDANHTRLTSAQSVSRSSSTISTKDTAEERTPAKLASSPLTKSKPVKVKTKDNIEQTPLPDTTSAKYNPIKDSSNTETLTDNQGQKNVNKEVHQQVKNTKSNGTAEKDTMKSSTNNSDPNNTTESFTYSNPAELNRETKAKIQCTDSTSMSVIESKAESFVLIWLDQTIKKNKDTVDSEQKLRAIVNSLVTCHTINEAMDLIEQVQDQQIYLIVSGKLGKQILSMNQIVDSSKLNSIYIFCGDQNENIELLQLSNKVRAIFVEIDPLCARLKEDTEQALKNLLPMSTTSGTSADEKNQVKFLCSQLHRDLLFTMEYSNNARLELADFCSSVYKLSPAQLKCIQELKTEYHAGKAIWW
ncbi:unnamed protein product [Rotaria socialis]|uniref:DUF4590 domain-containing protein n=1 Tax=Rotaria socialis TaxID=392032 RepID=A0A820LVM4_9BILA|nr:unnamed protein product [Rotaria socialis]